MGKLRQSKFYDEIYDKYEYYKGCYKKSPFLQVWVLAADIVESFDIKDIFEIGCGTGQFAHLISDTFDTSSFKYYGFDFSKVAIQIAKSRNLANCIFEVKDALNEEVYDRNYNIAVATEVLEHTDDMKIISFIKSGTKFIFSVPTFDDPAHVRFFKTQNDIWERYKNVLEILSVDCLFNKYFICNSIKK